MYNKIKKIKIDKILVILAILTIIKLVLCTMLPVYFNYALKYDDTLMMKQGLSILDGNYLGPYNEATLIKGIFYPFLLAVFAFFKIPYTLGMSCFYIGSIIILTYSLSRFIKNKKTVYLIYLFLLFNPLSFALLTFQKIYRNSACLSLTFYIMGFLLLLYADYQKDFKKVFKYSFFVGLFYFLFCMTREDSFWLIPIIVIIFGYAIYQLIKNKNYKNIMLFIIPVLTYIILINIVCIINYKYYGVYTTNELINSNYSKAFTSIISIRPNEEIKRVSITSETLKDLEKISPSFAKIYQGDLSNKYIEAWKNAGQIDNTSIIWALRAFASKSGYYENSKISNKLWKDIYHDVEKYKKENNIDTRFTLNSIFIVPFNFIYTKQLIAEYFGAIKYVVFLDDVSSSVAISTNNPDKENIQRILNSNVIYSPSYEYYHEIKYNTLKRITSLLNIITLIYKILIPILTILGLEKYLYNLIKRNNMEKLIFLTACIIGFLLIIFGVTYTHVTAFPSITYYYLISSYGLLFIFIILSLSLPFDKEFNKIKQIINFIQKEN